MLASLSDIQQHNRVGTEQIAFGGFLLARSRALPVLYCPNFILSAYTSIHPTTHLVDSLSIRGAREARNRPATSSKKPIMKIKDADEAMLFRSKITSFNNLIVLLKLLKIAIEIYVFE